VCLCSGHGFCFFFDVCYEVLHKITLQCKFFFSSADEIMHQDIIPLYAADIQDQLKKQFAYLSGKTLVFSSTDIAQVCGWACCAFIVLEISYRRN